MCLCHFGCFCVGLIFNLTNVLMAGVPKAIKERRGENKTPVCLGVGRGVMYRWGDRAITWTVDTNFNMSRNSGEIKNKVATFLTEWYVVVAHIVLELCRHTISMKSINKNLVNTRSTQPKTFN